MKHPLHGLIALALLAGGPAARAETFDTCTGTITSLPAVITTPGMWCLARHLGTSLSSGTAISIDTSNVILDCNNFRISNLGAAAPTTMRAIAASNRTGVKVRNCDVRGFAEGVVISSGGTGHVVEDSRFDGVTGRGIVVFGDGGVIRRNHLLDTGGSAVFAAEAVGIAASGQMNVDDNTVDTVIGNSGAGADSAAVGIRLADGAFNGARGNTVRNISGAGSGPGTGIRVVGAAGMLVIDNRIAGAGYGIYCATAGNFARNNTLTGTGTPVLACGGDGNVSYP